MINLEETLEELGITGVIRIGLGMPPQKQAEHLVSCEPDMFGRGQQMTPATEKAWREMRAAAIEDGVELLLVSAYRSVEYQCELIQRKLSDGQCIEDILKVNAAPGYSEHHTGRALDLATPGCEPLIEAFEETRAFDWLCQNAGRFGFSLSYPRDNPMGIDYEPWHWAHREA
jgi:D-alanyl-D-alanine carboxypeptidase